jgi:small subunit ribosomal protein S5
MAKKNPSKSAHRDREPKEFDEEVLQIDRVTRVVKGGRRLRFRVTVAIGDRKGRVGIGVGKAAEVVNGIKKAITRAKKDLIKVPITKNESIPHEVRIKFKSAKFFIMPASPGTGVIAGGSLRKILSLAGVKNVLSKNYGTNNKLVTAQAAMKALSRLAPLKKNEKSAPADAPESAEATEEKAVQKQAKKRQDREAKDETPTDNQ